jgi:S-(hydroxymethyl)glutathione dehydrogenase / alcohol dehydrogenase
MSIFKAAVLFEQNKPLEVISMEKRDPGEGQVAVKMIAASLCGAQWNEIAGVKGPDKYLPHMMGHEGVGRVSSIGSGVRKVNVGDAVILHWRKGSGCDCLGPRFKSALGEIGSGAVTTFSEYTVVAENRVTKIDYDPELKFLYPLVGCALSTSWGLLRKEAKLKSGASLLICGAGGVGLALAFWARLFGVARLAVYDQSDVKKTHVAEFGGEYYTPSSIGSISGIAGDFDVVVDTTGNVENISACFDRVKAAGKLILVGQPRVGETLKLFNPLKLFGGITIFSSDGGQFQPDEDLAAIVGELRRNKERLRALVSHVIRLDQVNEGFRCMRAGSAARVVIDFEEQSSE